MRFDLELLEFVECNKDSQKIAISASDKDLTWDEFKDEVEKLKVEILKYNLPKGHIFQLILFIQKKDLIK